MKSVNARRSMPGVESLEPRALMAGLAFNFTVVDPGHELAPYPLFAPDLVAAGQIVSSHIQGIGKVAVEVQVDDQISRADGAPGAAPSVAQGGLNVQIPPALTEAAGGFDSNGATPDILIRFSATNYLPTLWFDPSLTARNATPDPTKVDFMSDVLHELFHGLGIISDRNPDGSAYGGYNSNYRTLFDQHQVDGATGALNIVDFVGPNVQAIYGAPVPLTSIGPGLAGSSQNFSHLSNPVGLSGDPNDGLQADLMNGLSFDYGHRYAISNVDLAILADLGYSVVYNSTPTPTPTPTPSTGSLSGFAFNDSNNNGRQDRKESRAGGLVVYVDLNGDGAIENGEPYAYTNRQGNFTIGNLAPGTYLVGIVLRKKTHTTLPSLSNGTARWRATVASGQDTPGNNFGIGAGLLKKKKK